MKLTQLNQRKIKWLKTLRWLFLFSILLTAMPVKSQQKSITISGNLKNQADGLALPFVNIIVKTSTDSTFVSGTISNESGVFTLAGLIPGEYLLEASFIGFKKFNRPFYVGSNSAFLNLGDLTLTQNFEELGEVIISGEADNVSGTLDKKTYNVDQNVSQGGGSVLQSMQSLPGITTQDGELQLRGNNQIMILIDGKQTNITGFGNQNGLDNIPASAVERIEIINNPSAKYDANGNGGIINIILKKEDQTGFNGKVGLTAGLGALWVKKENLPGIRPQYQATPKISPSISLNYRKKNINYFFQANNLYTETLNKNEFITRSYADGTVVKQQSKRNRNTNFFTSGTGVDWQIDERQSLTVSAFFSQEAIKDLGDQPFFNEDLNERLRLWQFLEDEVLTAVMGSAVYEYKFIEPGRKLRIGFNYSFDREDEKYFFDNTLPTYESQESFFLIADQQVADLTADYTLPLKHGVFESGIKYRRRVIPTNMQFNPGINSPLDTNADGKATYQETIPAVYGNYRYEVKKLDMELGMRIEYVDLNYEVDPNHNTYKSNGYQYLQPFPNARVTYNLNPENKISAFFNRRVDRPDEVDIRIFPKYDDAEIIKVGNPALNPQFTNSFEVGYKNIWEKGYFYAAAYHRISDGTITRIATTAPGSNLIYNISQNAGRSYNTGLEVLVSRTLSDEISIDLNANVYRNQINAFTVVNLYPVASVFTADKQDLVSGNIKGIINLKVADRWDAQLTAIYLAPDIIPQGKIDARFSLDFGLKRSLQGGKGELFINATDLLNTMVIRKQIDGSDFSYTSADFYETQVIRIGYSCKF